MLHEITVMLLQIINTSSKEIYAGLYSFQTLAVIAKLSRPTAMQFRDDIATTLHKALLQTG